MEQRHTTPWTGIALAVLACAALATVGKAPWFALAILLIWLGTLWLKIDEPPPVETASGDASLTRDTMAELIEHSGTPLLLTRRDRVTIANRAAREVLGPHILGQDVRIALRHPEAIALAERSEPASATVYNLARRRDVWLVSRKPFNGHYAVIDLLDQSAGAQIGRAHTDFVANASHELRTPLASIIGYVETLLDEPGDEALRTRFQQTILREAKRLQQLVDDLLSLSRVEAGEHDLPSEHIDLAPLVLRAARDAAGPGRGERIEFSLTDATIQGDVPQLEQAVRNVIDNGLKYGADEGRVDVSLKVDGPAVLLTIADQGDGIPPDHLPHLTRRFYRVDPGRSRASGGTGLGLALVKHIVERHRGRLDIASEPGAGTTVEIRLPIARSENSASHDTVTQL